MVYPEGLGRMVEEEGLLICYGHLCPLQGAVALLFTAGYSSRLPDAGEALPLTLPSCTTFVVVCRSAMLTLPHLGSVVPPKFYNVC